MKIRGSVIQGCFSPSKENDNISQFETFVIQKYQLPSMRVTPVSCRKPTVDAGNRFEAGDPCIQTIFCNRRYFAQPLIQDYGIRRWSRPKENGNVAQENKS